jgi:hypothetical protein
MFSQSLYYRAVMQIRSPTNEALIDGTTTLFGASWSTLHIRPIWCFDIWTRDRTRIVHMRVMNRVRRLAKDGLKVDL